ncbi:lipoprotein [Celeribacter persicus]|jgi:hypothetical protein|uniref:Lipoprotein n=1 Tax=Celeribacter persicus TaxID=1651082 RepID=A0A2T5HM83_9RHOB|nr:hypothetical protein [Celeribacter persicus]PTQ72691.1 hypothetical protein C8N42_106201 [Celeribacter persicus]
MRKAFLATLAALTLAACQSDTPEDAPGYGLAGYDPKAAETGKAACDARGGDFRAAGLGGFMTCFTTPKDAGKSCSKSTDCSSNMCLARSRTCAPITPLFGCNDLLDAEGRQVSLCVD